MVPALILVLAAWCPITTTMTAPEQPMCPCPAPTATTATTAPPETSTTEPQLITHPDPFPAPTAATGPPVLADATTLTRPPPPGPVRRLPETGSGGALVVDAGLLVFVGGLLVAARPGHPRG